MHNVPNRARSAKQAFLGLTVAISLAVVGSSVAVAAVPTTIPVEGALLSSGGGAAADGFYDVTFAIYPDASSNNPVWVEGPTKIGIKSGQFSYVLGSSKALSATILNGSGLYLGMQVATDPELPRKPLSSVAFAVRAAVAEGLECSGCVGASALDPQALAAYAKTTDLSGYAKSASLAKVATSGAFADLTGGPDLSGYAKSANLAKVATSGAFADLSGGPDLTAYAKSSDLSAYVKASSLAKVAGTGAYADLSGLPVEAQLGKTCGTGLVMNGINADGSYACIASAIAGDMIDEISNGLIWNQFTDSTAGAVGTKIPDALGAGVTDTLTFPDIGQAQKIWVNMAITNSDMTGVKVELYGPGIANPYLLYNGGKTGTALTTNFNTDLPIVSGDMNKDWVGQNIKGTWSIIVKDLKAGGATAGFDGAFNWSMNIQTLSNQKIQIKGNLIVDKDVTIGGNLKVTGSINGASYAAPAGASVYRWNTFSTYDYGMGWYFGNDGSFYGGVAPSTWSDGNGLASNMSADKNVLRTLFSNKGFAGKNALVYAQQYVDWNSSTAGRHVASLFRVRNNTTSDASWTFRYYYTSYGSYNEYASCALNGVSVFSTSGNCRVGQCYNDVTVAIPKSRVSTLICINGASPQNVPNWEMHRHLMMGFGNNSLALPTGVEFIDDFDSASGDFTQ